MTDGEPPLFYGHQPRECGEHRTVGPHRAWCLADSEWCYRGAAMACRGCRIPMADALIEALEGGQSAAREGAADG